MSNFKLKTERAYKYIQDFNEKCSGCNKCQCLMMEDLNIEMKSFTTKVLTEGFTKKQAYSCVGCMQCNLKCNLDVNEVFQSLKSDVCCQLEDNKIFSTPYILQKQVNLSHNIVRPNSKVVFMPGCTLNKYYPDLVKKVFKQLKAFNPEIELYKGCCTKPVKLLGKSSLHNYYLNQYEEKFKDVLVINACFSCKNILNDFVNTVTLYEYLLNNDLVVSRNFNEKFSLKLPCHIDKKNQELCKNFCTKVGVSILNEDSTCCGSGGLIGYSNYKLSKKYLSKSIENLDSNNIVCFCAECNSKIKKNKESRHILEFI